MKKLAVLTAILAAISLGGVSIASAQNTGGPAGPGTSPSNINKSPHYVSPSGQSEFLRSTTAASGGKIKKNNKAAAEKREKKDLKQTTGAGSKEK